MAELTSQAAASEALAHSGHSLRGRMGTLGLLFAVLAYNAPVGIFVAFLPVVIGYGNGLGAPVSFLVAGAILGLFAVGFVAMGKHLPNPGAFYAYITAGMGRPAGLAASFLALSAYNLIQLGTYSFVGLALQAFVRDSLSGPDIAWWVYTLVAMLMVGVVGYFNVEVSAKVLTVALAFELILVGLYNAVVVGRGGAEGLHFESFTPDAFLSGSLGLGLLFAMTMFGGFEATAIFREEVRDPERDVPRATYLAVALITVLYAVGTWVIIQALGAGSAVEMTATDPAGSVLASAQSFLGSFGRDAFTILVITSGLAAILSTHNIAARYGFSLAMDGILPKFFAGVHQHHGSPHRCSIGTSVLMVAALAVLIATVGESSTLYASIIGFGGYVILVLLLVTAVSVLVYLNRHRATGFSPWQRTISPVAAIVGLSVTIYLATTNLALLIGGSQTLANVFLGLLAGLAGLGVALALLFRRTRPDVYRRIGRQA